MTTADGLRIRCLSWDPECERSIQIAARLGVELETIHYLAYRRPAVAPLKYVLQTAATLRSLARDWPDVVFMSNPPPFGPLALVLAQRLRPGLRFVMDTHTGPFLEPKWRWLLPLTRFLARRSSLTVVTNAHLGVEVASWGAPAFVLSNPLPALAPPGRKYPVEPGRFNVVAVCSYYEDEPIADLLRVRDLPADVRVYVTGDSRRAPRALTRQLSSQVTLCGFLDAGDYTSLLEQSDAVLVLCTRPHTLLQGAADAASLAKPLITSDWPVMREVFTRGTVWVGHTTASIEAGIRAMRRDHDTLASEMRALASTLRTGWEAEFQAFERHLHSTRGLGPDPRPCLGSTRRTSVQRGAPGGRHAAAGKAGAADFPEC